jgi:hypothetical protein
MREPRLGTPERSSQNQTLHSDPATTSASENPANAQLNPGASQRQLKLEKGAKLALALKAGKLSKAEDASPGPGQLH